MTTGASLNDLKNVLGQIKNYSFDAGSWGLTEQEKGYVNSVWTAGEGVEEIASGNDEEKAKGFQKLLSELMSIAGKIGNREAQEAKREVTEQEKKAQQINAEAEETQREIQNKITAISGNIAEEVGVIEAAQGEIDKAQQVLEEKQKELQETLEQIAKLKDELGQTTNPAEQNGLLGQIATLSAALPNIVSEISNIQQILIDNVNEVASSAKVMQELEGTAETTAAQGAKEIKEETDESKKLAADGTTTTATGATNEGVADAAKTAQTVTTVTSFIPGAGTEAQRRNQQLMEIERDQSGAAGERLPGGAATLKSVAQVLGTVNSSINYLAEFKNAIGTGLQDYSNAVGIFGTTVEPMITSLGSFNEGKDILENKAEIDAAVEEDFTTIREGGVDTETPEMLKRPEDNQNQGFTQNVWSTQPTNFFSSSEDNEPKNNLKTPRVNVVQFGI